MKDNSKDSIDAAKHMPEYDASRINRAIEKASRDPNFVSQAVAKLAEFKFPAFKRNIIDYIKSINVDEDVVSLFESLNGYIQFRDQYHVQKALEENVPAKKKDYQITDKTREGPHARIRQTTADASIKHRETGNDREERKDYPEVTPTSMSNFVCDRCGKNFQNQQDLVHHKQFESGQD
ncbi:MAG: hypothetical protein M3258_01125 [Thermoproteota archaeon]|jgi:hypothetical protein|nr:hypothetical protein [Thermoproteota archaeon]